MGHAWNRSDIVDEIYTSTALPRLAVLSVLSAASSPCPDLNLIHYNKKAFIEGLSWFGEAAGVIAVLQLIPCLEAWVA